MNSFRLLTIPVALLILITANANAQKLEFGLTGGINFSSHLKEFQYSVDENTQMQLSPKIASSYQAGLVLRGNFSRSIRLQAEPSFIFLGASYEESFPIRGQELETQSQTELLYLQLPLLFQISTIPSEDKARTSSQYNIHGSSDATTTFHFSGGIYGGYLLDARFYGTNSGAPLGVSFEESFSNDITSQFSQFNGGVLLGLGLEHGDNRKLGLETRALYSFLNSGEAQQLPLLDMQSYALTLSAYILF